MLFHKCRYCGNGQYIEISPDGSIVQAIGCTPYIIHNHYLPRERKPSKKLLLCKGSVPDPLPDSVDETMECGREVKVSSFKAMP